MCNERFQLMQDFGVQYVSATALSSYVKLKRVETMAPNASGHAAGSAVALDEEGTGDQVEVSRPDSSVSTF